MDHPVKCELCGRRADLAITSPSGGILALCRPCAQQVVDENPGEVPTLAAALARDQS